jgi:hypothetical protein
MEEKELEPTQEKLKAPDNEEGDIGDIAGEFHTGGGIEGYGHAIQPHKGIQEKLNDLEI